MTGMRLLPLGIGSALSALYYTTCLALECEGAWLLLDCPHPIRKMMREGARAAGITLDVDQVVGVALSHLHADHCSGIEDLAFFNYFVLNRRTTLLAHPDVALDLWPKTLSGGMGVMSRSVDKPSSPYVFEDFFDWKPVEETTAVTLGPFRVECRKAVHSIPTTAFRVEGGGRRFGFSADTDFDQGLIDWLAEADLVAHETTTYGNAGLHTPYHLLVGLPDRIRSRLRLLHYPDDFDIRSSAIPVLREGELIDV